MTNNIISGTLVFVAIILSFAFGWSVRGDVIYSGLFEQKAQVMERLK